MQTVVGPPGSRSVASLKTRAFSSFVEIRCRFLPADEDILDGLLLKTSAPAQTIGGCLGENLFAKFEFSVNLNPRA